MYLKVLWLVKLALRALPGGHVPAALHSERRRDARHADPRPGARGRAPPRAAPGRSVGGRTTSRGKNTKGAITVGVNIITLQ